MKDTSWDHALEVTADGNGLVGHGGGDLAAQACRPVRPDRRARRGTDAEGDVPAAQPGDGTASTASRSRSRSRWAPRDADIEVLGQLAPVLGTAPSGSTVRRTLDLADDRTLTRISQARARTRAYVWELVEAAGGFPWLEIAGKTLTGWLFIDMDGTLITAYSPALGTGS